MARAVYSRFPLSSEDTGRAHSEVGHQQFRRQISATGTRMAVSIAARPGAGWARQVTSIREFYTAGRKGQPQLPSYLVQFLQQEPLHDFDLGQALGFAHDGPLDGIGSLGLTLL